MHCFFNYEPLKAMPENVAFNSKPRDQVTGKTSWKNSQNLEIKTNNFLQSNVISVTTRPMQFWSNRQFDNSECCRTSETSTKLDWQRAAQRLSARLVNKGLQVNIRPELGFFLLSSQLYAFKQVLQGFLSSSENEHNTPIKCGYWLPSEVPAILGYI